MIGAREGERERERERRRPCKNRKLGKKEKNEIQRLQSSSLPFILLPTSYFSSWDLGSRICICLLGIFLFSGPFEPLSSYMFRFIWLLPFLLLSAHRAHIPNWDRFSPSCEIGAGAELNSLPALFPRLGRRVRPRIHLVYVRCMLYSQQNVKLVFKPSAADLISTSSSISPPCE